MFSCYMCNALKSEQLRYEEHELECGKQLTCDLSISTSWLTLSLVLLVSSTTILGVISPERVGVGVVERGGLGRLDIGEVARDAIREPGTDAEKNFFDTPKVGLKDLVMFSEPR